MATTCSAVSNSDRRLEAATPVQYVKGVGPVRAQQLRRLGIETAQDLLLHFPVDYDHPGESVGLDSVREGQRVITRARVLDSQVRRTRRGQTMVVATVGEGSARLRLTWFNAPWMSERLRQGRELVIRGDVTRFGRQLQIVNAQIEAVEEGEARLEDPRPKPRYPLTGGLSQGTLRKIQAGVVPVLSRGVLDPLDAEQRSRYGFPSRAEALSGIHLPQDLDQAQSCRRRLAFDEALALQLAVGVRRRRLLRRGSRWRLGEFGPASGHYVQELGFALTGAQRRVLRAIAEDLRQPTAMHRLLQGDVGSGKTLVAIVAMIWTAEGGGQAAFMAPTEVLARQHASRQIPRLEALGLRAAVLTGSTPLAERREVLRGLASGEIQCVFGTHALLQPDVLFAKLALAVVDEQHRFGVAQRATLARSGAHLLVMTATPIPRSLALTVYGDLDLSVIDELPPGRRPIETDVVDETALDRIYVEIRERAQRGERTYLVYPLVEESEGADLASAEGAFAELCAGALEGLRVGLLHGRLPHREKDRVCSAFARGDLEVLVATTVIEVGIDVPEATLMVIRHAERFGLAQLHQLRGRVGRGGRASRCRLVLGPGVAAPTFRRLQHLASTEDGFEIAELDLRQRGMGDLHGLRQHGELPFRLLNPIQDEALVQESRILAEAILAEDPQLQASEHETIARWLDEMGRLNPLWSSAG